MKNKPFFSVNKTCNIGGSLKNLLHPNDELNECGYMYAFTNVPVVDASNLTLDLPILQKNCYSNMFRNCINLVVVPELPATTLANGCYNAMFYGCTSLTQTPVLPATILNDDCYVAMFEDCKALIQAPELPATILAERCYRRMFFGCSNLT